MLVAWLAQALIWVWSKCTHITCNCQDVIVTVRCKCQDVMITVECKCQDVCGGIRNCVLMSIGT